MSFVRRVGPVLVAGLLCAASLLAQESSGAITGKVVDATTQQPIGNVEVSIPGTNFRTSSGNDGGFLLNRVPAGTYNVRAGRIGYGIQLQSATVTAGGTATVQFTLQPAASVLEPVVVTGY